MKAIILTVYALYNNDTINNKIMKRLIDTIIDILCEVISENRSKIVKNITTYITVKTISLFIIVPIAVIITVYALYINRDSIFIDKFKLDIQDIPQSIDQNLKEDLVYSTMIEYTKECKDNGIFLFYRIEMKDQYVDLQVKHAIVYDNIKNIPINLIEGNLKLKRYLTKRNKASNSLQQILTDAKEGNIYVLEKRFIDSIGSEIKTPLEPFLSSFKLMHDSYYSFKYIPVFHKKLGLIILIGYLDSTINQGQCKPHDIAVMLENLYLMYK
jgi:hypothetical protein